PPRPRVDRRNGPGLRGLLRALADDRASRPGRQARREPGPDLNALAAYRPAAPAGASSSVRSFRSTAWLGSAVSAMTSFPVLSTTMSCGMGPSSGARILRSLLRGKATARHGKPDSFA